LGGAAVERAPNAEEAAEVGGVAAVEGREAEQAIGVAVLQATVEAAGQAGAFGVQVGDDLVDVDEEIGEAS
jgi:hypothetical protein